MDSAQLLRFTASLDPDLPPGVRLEVLRRAQFLAVEDIEDDDDDRVRS